MEDCFRWWQIMVLSPSLLWYKTDVTCLFIIKMCRSNPNLTNQRHSSFFGKLVSLSQRIREEFDAALMTVSMSFLAECGGTASAMREQKRLQKLWGTTRASPTSGENAAPCKIDKNPLIWPHWLNAVNICLLVSQPMASHLKVGSAWQKPWRRTASSGYSGRRAA